MYLIKGHIISLLYFALSTSSFSVLIFVKRFVFLYIKWKWKSNQIREGDLLRKMTNSWEVNAHSKGLLTRTRNNVFA